LAATIAWQRTAMAAQGDRLAPAAAVQTDANVTDEALEPALS
jgi:hypothetical protein